MLDLQARVFVDELLQDLPHALLVAAALGLDGQAMHRHRKLQRLQVQVIVLGGVVQHRIEVHLVDLGHRADVARHAALNLDVLLALQLEQVAHLERLAPVADVELAVLGDGALVDAEDAHLADVGVDGDLEHMRDDVLGGVGVGVQLLRIRALAFVELGRIAFGGVGQQAVEHVEQLGHAGAVARGGEADRDQVPFAQRLLQRAVQLLRVDVAVVEVALDEIGVDFDHLLDQRAVRRLDRREVRLVPRLRRRVEEAVDDFGTACRRQVQRQAFLAERRLDLRHESGQIQPLRLDLVDDDHAAQLPLGRPLHHARGHHLDADLRVDHDRRGVHGLERRHRLADEVGIPGRVEQVDARFAVQEVDDRRVERVLDFALEGVEVADRGASLQAARCTDRPRLPQQRLDQAGLARRCLPDEGDRSDAGNLGVGSRHGAVSFSATKRRVGLA